jgi:hypothetical protein
MRRLAFSAIAFGMALFLCAGSGAQARFDAAHGDDIARGRAATPHPSTIRFAQNLSKISVPAAPAAEITGVWKGFYYYADGRAPVEFKFQFENANGACKGRSDEGNTFGSARSNKLYASLECDSVKLAPGKTVLIRKHYDGTASVSHAVRYVGSVWPDLEQITGQWEIGVTRGSFMMRRQ